MDELDARLRAMAKREHLTLPTAYETAMQKHVDTLAAKLMLQGDVGAQDTIIIDVEDGKLVARSQSVCE